MDETKKQPEEIVKSAEPPSPELSEAALEQVAGGTKTQADAPTESVSFNFTKIQLNYEQQE
jgi:type VI protein secretion system component Hcp